MKQIVFIGLGHMGTLMITNLLKAGYLLNVFDLMRSAADGLVVVSANAAHSARDTAQGADVVISILPTNQHVEGLCLDNDGLLTHIAPGTLVLECSAIAPTSACKIHVAACERGLATLDAPVSGGTANAATSTLTFMVGGDAETLEKARSLFEVMGRSIFHAGPDDADQVAKVCNNQPLAALTIGTAEAMALDVVGGLKTKVLARIIYHSSDGSQASEVYNPQPGVMENVPTSRNCNDGSVAQLAAEDLGLVQKAAQTSASSTSMGSLTLSLYRLLLKQGYAEQDFSVMQKPFDPTQG